jgi:hypothetical protein
LTLCAAGINYGHNRIVVVCDRKLSFWGGSFSADGMAFKVTDLCPQWYVMFSGPNSPLVPLINAVVSGAKKVRTNTLRSIASACARAYRVERKAIIENEVLAKYDVGSYDEFLALKISERELYDSLATEIKEAEEGWNLLFCGFDRDGKPHIFVITEYGKIQYCDLEGFAVIGSGSWAAMVSLANHPFSTHLSLGEVTYSLLAAKFSAEESADGVGDQTVLAVLRPGGMGGVPTLSDDQIDKLRLRWKNLPRIPPSADYEIQNSLEEMEQVFYPVVKQASDTMWQDARDVWHFKNPATYEIPAGILARIPSLPPSRQESTEQSSQDCRDKQFRQQSGSGAGTPENQD